MARVRDIDIGEVPEDIRPIYERFFNDNKEVPISKIFTKDNVDSILG